MRHMCVIVNLKICWLGIVDVLVEIAYVCVLCSCCV